MIRVSQIQIKDIGPIKKLSVKLNPKFNIICGQNGVGKTTFLECIGQSFSYNHTQTLRRKANSSKGSWTIGVNINAKEELKTFETEKFHPNDKKFANNHGFIKNANEVIVFKTHRSFDYINLTGVNRDPNKDENVIQTEASNGIISNDIKQWFVHRYLWSARKGDLADNQIKNFKIACNTFSLLDNKIKFNKVDPTTNDIILTTSQGDIFFEYLSSGFKSCIAVLLGLIKEIEFRFVEPFIFVEEFKGIVIIDELDLHLHPEWQALIYKAIKAILPNAQVITSTHSPHIIQFSEPQELIPLVFDDSGDVVLKEIPFNNEYGFQGWTIEEILSDVMGLKNTMTEAYNNMIINFGDAIDNDDINEANKSYEELNKMLHPDNHLRKILKLQLTKLSDKNDTIN